MEASLQNDLQHLRRSFRVACGVVMILWCLHVLQMLPAVDLSGLAIVPRQIGGLVGILGAPLIHADMAHLISNSLPILILLTGTLYLYPRAAPWTLAIIYLCGGTAVWLFARPSAHLGASGLTYGLLTYLFFGGVLRRDPPSIGLALIVAFLYGGTIWGVLPIEAGVSFESHLAGACLGVLCAVLFRRLDFPHAPRSWFSWRSPVISPDDNPEEFFDDYDDYDEYREEYYVESDDPDARR